MDLFGAGAGADPDQPGLPLPLLAAAAPAAAVAAAGLEDTLAALRRGAAAGLPPPGVAEAAAGLPPNLASVLLDGPAFAGPLEDGTGLPAGFALEAGGVPALLHRPAVGVPQQVVPAVGVPQQVVPAVGVPQPAQVGPAAAATATSGSLRGATVELLMQRPPPKLQTSSLQVPWRCLDRTHGPDCTACQPPPFPGEVGSYELVGDPKRRNGEKKLRKLLQETPEWKSEAERHSLADTLEQYPAYDQSLVVTLRKRLAPSLRKAHLLLLVYAWGYKVRGARGAGGAGGGGRTDARLVSRSRSFRPFANSATSGGSGGRGGRRRRPS